MAGVPKLILIGDTLITLYRNMVRMREFAERLEEDDQTLTPDARSTPAAIGCEAIAAGVSFHLSADDIVFASHPSLAVALGKDVDATALAAQWMHRAGGCSGGLGGSRIYAAPEHGLLGAMSDSAAPLLNAIGAAAAKQSDNDPSTLPLTLAFFGADGLVDGGFYEAIRCAGEWELPCVFVGQIDTARGLDTQRWATFARTHGWAAVQANGRQVSEVYAAAHEAVRRAREDEGPSLLLFDTAFALAGESLPQEDDPIEVMRQQLLDDNSFSLQELEELHSACEADVDAAIDRARQSAPANWSSVHRLRQARQFSGDLT